MKKVYLDAEPGEHVFLVFSSKKEGYKKTIILECEIDEITIQKNVHMYRGKVVKCANDRNEDITKYCEHFYFSSSNINTGLRTDNKHWMSYPVFTTKEKVLQWLKESKAV